MLQRYGRLKLTSCLSINLQVQVQVIVVETSTTLSGNVKKHFCNNEQKLYVTESTEHKKKLNIRCAAL